MVAKSFHGKAGRHSATIRTDCRFAIKPCEGHGPRSWIFQGHAYRLPHPATRKRHHAFGHIRRAPFLFSPFFISQASVLILRESQHDFTRLTQRPACRCHYATCFIEHDDKISPAAFEALRHIIIHQQASAGTPSYRRDVMTRRGQQRRFSSAITTFEDAAALACG